MYIKDMTNGTVRRYGTNVHDSLQISEDGRTLSYENLQNGDGSRYGGYRFCDSDGKVPEEDEVLVKHGANAYFNIGGFSADPFRFGRSAFSKTEEVLRLYYKIRLSKTDKAKELCQKVETALQAVKNDQYYNVIVYYYFDNLSTENIADKMKVDCSTVSRNKKRLVEDICAVVFTDDLISELFS